MNNTIIKRQNSLKEMLLEELKKTPVVQIACRKCGISRATFYRWKASDEKFTKEVNTALEEGTSLINDMAESQLISAIKDQNLGAIVFWLKSHHPAYANKVEVTAHLKNQAEKLTPEQEALVTRALQLASLISNKETENKKEEK